MENKALKWAWLGILKLVTPEASGVRKTLDLSYFHPPYVEIPSCCCSVPSTWRRKEPLTLSWVSAWCVRVQREEKSFICSVPWPGSEYPCWAARARFVSTAEPLAEHQTPKEHHQGLGSPRADGSEQNKALNVWLSSLALLRAGGMLPHLP